MGDKKIILMAGTAGCSDFTLGADLECGPFTVVYEDLSTAIVPRIKRQSPDVVMIHAKCLHRTDVDLCADLRRHYDGLIIVCMDDDDEQDQLLAYAMGVDDIIRRTISPHLLIARLNAMLRRAAAHTRGNLRSSCITIGDLRIDASRREAFLKDRSLHLTSIQFDLLWYLMQNAGVTVTRDNLCRVLFDVEYNGIDRAIDVYISRIRRKLNDNPRHPAYIKTVRGVGYLFAAH